MAHVGIHAPENNINGCELVLEQAHSLCHSNAGLHVSTLCILEFYNFSILKMTVRTIST